MVRTYKKKSSRPKWDDGQMHLAIQAVLDGKSVKSTATDFGIPRSTLQFKVAEANKICQNPEKGRAGFSRTTFTAEQEKSLARYIEYMESHLIGLTSTDVRKLAFQFAEKLKIPHNFNKTKKLAGKDWLRSFMKRHDFSHRKAEHTSSARANGFNQQAVQAFFTLLKKVLEEHKFTPDKIYNVDETGISVVPKSSPKIIAKKGRRQVGGLTAAERGKTVTAEICMSATGGYMPPMLIFPRVKENAELLNDAPPGVWAEYHKSGYMQTEIFAKWFQKFIEFSHATPGNPVLLLLDGSHTKNLKVIDLARDNGVTILCFPPHCTHKMQPLDVGFMGPLNSCFGKEVSALQRTGAKVSLKNLFSVFDKAYTEAAKIETAINAFKKCGISPFNPEIFSETDFAASQRDTFTFSNDSSNSESMLRIAEYTEIIKAIMDPSQEVNSSQIQIGSQSAESNKSCTNTGNVNNLVAEDEVRIPLSYVLQAKPLIDLLSSCITSTSQSNHTSDQIEMPTSIVPNVQQLQVNPSLINQNAMATATETATEIATATEIKVKKSRAKGKAAVITSDMYKENLMAEKLKNIKKEPIIQKKMKPKIKSVEVLSTQYNVASTSQTTQAVKRKQSTTTGARKKRKPLESLNNQVQVKLDSTISQPFLIHNSDGVSLEEGEYLLPVSNLSQPFLEVQGPLASSLNVCYVADNTFNALTL